MVMEIAEKRTKRTKAVPKAVSAAEQDDLSVRHVERLSELVLEKFPQAFRRALVGGPSAKVSPMAVRRKLEEDMVRAWPRVYSPKKKRLVDRILQTVGGGGDGDSKSLDHVLERSDGRAERQQVPHGGILPQGNSAAHGAGCCDDDAIPRLEKLGLMLEGAAAFCTLDIIQGH